MGGDTNTSTQTSSTAPSNPQVTATVNQLLGGLSGAYNAGAPPVFNQSLYSPAGGTTQNAWASSLSAAQNPGYAQGVNSSLGYANNLLGNGGLTSGQQGLSGQYANLGGAFDQNAPGYQNVRNNAANDAQTAINAQFNNSGRLGGFSADKALGQGVTNALSNLDYGNYQNSVANHYNSLNAQAGLQQQGVNNAFGAASSLPGLYSALQQPSATMGAIGAAQDANQQGILQGNYDLSQRQANNQTDWLAKLSGILSGNAQTSGNTNTSTTSTPATPWWQSLAGLGVSLL